MKTNRFLRIGDPMRSRTFFYGAILAAIFCLAGSLAARADDTQVTAAVSDDSPDVGQSVDFTITVNGASDATVPQNIDVDGLTITYEGRSVQSQMSFDSGFGGGAHSQRTMVCAYSVVARRAGDFLIPGQQVTVGGVTYTTRPVSLKAGGGPGASGGGAPAGANQAPGNGKLYYAEFVLPRDTAYIGEAVPIEIRLYVDARVRAQLEEAPEITAQGCTVEKTGKPVQSEVTRNGREYVMVTYKTAVTAAKAGMLKVGPVQVAAEAQLPARRPPRPQGGAFDDPFFQNPMFDDALQMMSPPQQIMIKGDPIPLTALPLPAEGQPRSFAGAVGNFSMKTSVKPTMVEAGDPVTVTAKISGRGNFDRVTAPQITDPDGWRTYPPSATFEGDDDVGISGTKTFEMAAIPQTTKTASPALEWSYFDPVAEKYVTLTDGGTPIKIEGQIQAAATPVVVAQATPPPSQGGPDISYIRADSAGWGESFQPIYENRLFWAAQGGPLVALLAFAGMQVARKRAADEQARVRAQLHREKDAAMAAMQRRDVPEGELYQAAARALRLAAALQTGRAPDTLDGTEVANARVLDEALAERVRRVFDQQGETLYAGTSGGRRAASAETKVEVLETVKGYENAERA
jgi:hypothetical protein